MDVFAYWNLQQLWTVFNAAAAMTGNNAYQTLMFALGPPTLLNVEMLL